MNADLQTGVFYALVSELLWGFGPLLLKRGMTLSNVSTATLIEQYVSVIVLVAISIFRGELFLLDVSGTAFWAFVAAGAIGASFGKIFYYKGIDKVGASKSTSVKNSSPILTVLLAVILLGEELTFPVAAGSVLIVIGILVLSQVEVKGEERPSRFTYFFTPSWRRSVSALIPFLKRSG